MALIHNPIADLTGPLNRVEAAVSQLSEELATLEALPAVHTALVETNERLSRVEQETRLARIAGERAAVALEAIGAELARNARGLGSAAADGSG